MFKRRGACFVSRFYHLYRRIFGICQDIARFSDYGVVIPNSAYLHNVPENGIM